MPDWSDFQKAEAAKKGDALVAAARQQAALARAARTLGRHLADLVGTDEWATYRLGLEAARTGEQAQLAALEGQILSPDTVSDALLKLKLQHARIAGRIEGLTVALNVPAQYQELAEAAAE